MNSDIGASLNLANPQILQVQSSKTPLIRFLSTATFQKGGYPKISIFISLNM